MMDTALLISGMALSALASGAVTLAYYRAKSSDMVKAYIERGEQLSLANNDYIEQLLRVLHLQDKLDAISAKQPIRDGNGKFTSKAKHNAERAAMRAKAKHMAVGMGRDDLAGRLA
jgi:hypothetical protein